VLDAIADDFDRDTLSSRYSTPLHPRFQAGARYALFPHTLVDLSVFAVYNHKLFPAVTLSVSQGFGNYFNFVLSTSYTRTIHNVGIGLMFKPGPFQFYMVADNLLPLLSPLHTTHVNLRAGVNFVFGRGS
jgi:hypothetical protein